MVGTYSVHGGMSAPIESTAENRFDDEVIGGARGADADAEIDFPHWRDVEVGDEKELLLLVMGRGEVTQGPIICVVLEAGADYPREIIADLGAWCQAQALDIDALGEFQRLMFLMIGRINPIDGFLLAVAVKLECSSTIRFPAGTVSAPYTWIS